jgi:hypothetical protein
MGAHRQGGHSAARALFFWHHGPEAISPAGIDDDDRRFGSIRYSSGSRPGNPIELAPLLTSPRLRGEVGLPRRCEASSGAIRVRGAPHLRRQNSRTEAPHPDPLRASFARLDPAKSGAREKRDQRYEFTPRPAPPIPPPTARTRRRWRLRRAGGSGQMRRRGRRPYWCATTPGRPRSWSRAAARSISPAPNR